MKKESSRNKIHNVQSEKTNHNDKVTGEMRGSGNTMTPNKILLHPVSTPIFFFYTIMSVINGSAFLMLLGTAAAFGAWILEEIFMATSGLAQSGKRFSHRRDRTDSDVSGADVSCPEKEVYTGSRPEMVSRPGELLSMSNQGRIVFLRKRAS